MAGTATPDISVVMPVYNAEQYLREAVDSILAQTYESFELIASNDGSTDGTRDILEEYAGRDNRVHILNRANTGIVGALNDGLAVARAQFIARMDADDRSLPQRFEKQIRYLHDHRECVAVGCRALMIDPDGDPLGPFGDFCADHEQIEPELLAGNGSAMVHPSLMVRRETINAIGGYREQYQFAEDLDLFLRLGERGRLANLPDMLLDYRQHGGSVCDARGSLQERLLAAILKETYARRGLPGEPIDLVMARPTSEWGVRLRWLNLAHEAGYDRTARKHAYALLRRNPLSVRAWRVVFRAWIGIENAGRIRSMMNLLTGRPRSTGKTADT